MNRAVIQCPEWCVLDGGHEGSHRTPDGTTVSIGCSFSVMHVCSDGVQSDLYWDNEWMQPPPREWLVCPRCEYAVKLQTRSPSGVVM